VYRLLIILLLVATVGKGQIINASRYYVPLSQYSFLLDLYPTTGFAYSFRKLSSTYAGNCIRVRRSSDNTESNIGFVNNYLDTATLKTFVGVNNGFITTWYDQSGGGYDVSQSTATAQPSLVVSGVINYTNGNVCAVFNGSTNYLLSTTSFSSFATSLSFSSVMFNKWSTGAFYSYNYQFSIGINPPSTGFKSFISSAQNNYQDWVGGGTLMFGNGYPSSNNPRLLTPTHIYTNNSQNIWFGSLNSTENALKLNGSNAPITVNNTANVSTGGGTIALGTDNAIANFSTEYFQEVVVWQSNQISNATAIGGNVNNFYKVY